MRPDRRWWIRHAWGLLWKGRTSSVDSHDQWSTTAGSLPRQAVTLRGVAWLDVVPEPTWPQLFWPQAKICNERQKNEESQWMKSTGACYHTNLSISWQSEWVVTTTSHLNNPLACDATSDRGRVGDVIRAPIPQLTVPIMTPAEHFTSCRRKLKMLIKWKLRWKLKEAQRERQWMNGAPTSVNNE